MWQGTRKAHLSVCVHWDAAPKGVSAQIEVHIWHFVHLHCLWRTHLNIQLSWKWNTIQYILCKVCLLKKLTCTLRWQCLVAGPLDQANLQHITTVLWHWTQREDVWNAFWLDKHCSVFHLLSVLNDFVPHHSTVLSGKDQIWNQIYNRFHQK